MITITIILIVITVIMSFYAWNNPAVQQKWIFNPYRIHQRNEYYRFLTSGFIHADYIHLGFNMFTFYFFGQAIESIYGYLHGTLGLVYFVVLYLVGIIIADIPTYFKHKNHPHYNALGASGGVSAVVFSSIMFNPLNEIGIFGVIWVPGFILGILYLIYSVYMGKNKYDNVNHDAHLYGALFGIVFSIFIRPNVIIEFFQEVITYTPFS